MSKLFLILSIVFFVMWFVTTYGANVPLLGRLGHLPGDLHFSRGNFAIHLPLASSILVSILLTVVLRLFSRV